MKNKKITKKELNEKHDWIVTGLNHERYTFNIDTFIEKDKSIIEMLHNFCMSELVNRIERASYHNYAYAIDNIFHEGRDEYCVTEEEGKRFTGLHIETLLFARLDEFLENEVLGWCFGDTNKKFGVMDYAKKPVYMNEDLGDDK